MGERHGQAMREGKTDSRVGRMRELWRELGRGIYGDSQRYMFAMSSQC